jgi:hypothetical protein
MAITLIGGANADGCYEVLGIAVLPSEAEPFWTKFIRSLTDRGLRGVKLVISDFPEGRPTAGIRTQMFASRGCGSGYEGPIRPQALPCFVHHQLGR